MQFLDAYRKAREDLARCDPRDTVNRSGAVYHQEDGCYQLRYCNSLYTIAAKTGEIRSTPGAGELTHEEHILLLQYLVEASGIPPRGRWCSFLELPGGPHHYALFQKEAIFPLAEAFGEKPGALREAARPLGGQDSDLGEVGVVIPVFPKLWLAFMVWGGDDEFPPRANLLFDTAASTHLSTASLYVLGIEVSRKLRRIVPRKEA